VKILIVSNDSAGAEILSSWVCQNPRNEYSYILGNPAERIFRKKITSFNNVEINQLINIINKFDRVMTGTSQEADIEKKAIFFAKKNKINVISILDYWVNFSKRFIDKGVFIYPDEIWVMDIYAFNNAKKELPGSNLILKNNPYIEDLLSKKILKIKDEFGPNILYVCQPFNENGLTDIEALNYFFSMVLKLKADSKKVRIRVHPLESESKYEKIIEKYLKFFEIDTVSNFELSDDLNWSDWVVGMHSTALAVALEFGVKVFHCIPPNGKDCVLPHKEILNFGNYLELGKLREK
jgi:hypothetical protein